MTITSDEVWQLFKKLIEAQKETEKGFQEIKECFAQTDRRFREIERLF